MVWDVRHRDPNSTEHIGQHLGPLLCWVCEQEETTAPPALGGVSQERKLEMPFVTCPACHLPHKHVGILYLPGTREEQLEICRCFSTFCNSPES